MLIMSTLWEVPLAFLQNWRQLEIVCDYDGDFGTTGQHLPGRLKVFIRSDLKPWPKAPIP